MAVSMKLRVMRRNEEDEITLGVQVRGAAPSLEQLEWKKTLRAALWRSTWEFCWVESWT